MPASVVGVTSNVRPRKHTPRVAPRASVAPECHVSQPPKISVAAQRSFGRQRRSGGQCQDQSQGQKLVAIEGETPTHGLRSTLSALGRAGSLTPRGAEAPRSGGGLVVLTQTANLSSTTALHASRGQALMKAMNYRRQTRRLHTNAGPNTSFNADPLRQAA